MGIEEFVRSIRFNTIKPSCELSKYAKSYHDDFDIQQSNTIFPQEDNEIKDRIRTIWDIPKMSTLTIGAIINQAVSQMDDNYCYLNIGTWHGYSYFSGILDNDKYCIGVDNFSEWGQPRKQFLTRYQKFMTPKTHFYDMDYRKYFEEVHSMPVGVFFFDASTDYVHQGASLEYVEPFLRSGSVIIVDDTNVGDVFCSVIDFIARRPNEYRIIEHQITPHNCHPTYWNGLVIFLKQ